MQIHRGTFSLGNLRAGILAMKVSGVRWAAQSLGQEAGRALVTARKIAEIEPERPEIKSWPGPALSLTSLTWSLSLWPLSDWLSVCDLETTSGKQAKQDVPVISGCQGGSAWRAAGKFLVYHSDGITDFSPGGCGLLRVWMWTAAISALWLMVLLLEDRLRSAPDNTPPSRFPGSGWFIPDVVSFSTFLSPGPLTYSRGHRTLCKVGAK